MERVGFIGLGVMGSRMAQNILKGGYPLTVYDVDPTAVEVLQNAGETWPSHRRMWAVRATSSLPCFQHRQTSRRSRWDRGASELHELLWDYR